MKRVLGWREVMGREKCVLLAEDFINGRVSAWEEKKRAHVVEIVFIADYIEE